MNSDLQEQAQGQGDAQDQDKLAPPFSRGQEHINAAHHWATMLSSHWSLEKSSSFSPQCYQRLPFIQVILREICLIYLLWLGAHTDKAHMNSLPLNILDITLTLHHLTHSYHLKDLKHLLILLCD